MTVANSEEISNWPNLFCTHANSVKWKIIARTQFKTMNLLEYNQDHEPARTQFKTMNLMNLLNTIKIMNLLEHNSDNEPARTQFR